VTTKIARRAAGLALALAAVVAAGCGSDDNGGATTAAQPPASAKAPNVVPGVPAAVKAKGTLTVAADASYAPNEFIGEDGKTVEGMDADLGKALAAAMGLMEGLESLCGLTVAVEKGTTQQDDATAQSKKCKSAGKKEVKVLTFPDQNGANLALSSGRAQVGMADSPPAAYQVKKSNGQFKLVGKQYGTAPYGIAIPKDLGLTQAVLAAVKQVMADGQYKQILDKWGISAGAITTPQINGAIE